MKKLTAYVYIDGLNLFYGCLKGSIYKWLDINKLISFYFPKYELLKIKYFSAITKPRANDLLKPIRQLTYFRALNTLPNLEIILGTFLENETMAYVPEKSNFWGHQKVRVSFNGDKLKLPLSGRNYLIVKKTEEKGSDVNLATHLIVDAYEKRFDVAIVVSNDSDLVGPIKAINGKNKVFIRLLSPYRKVNRELLEAVKGNIKIIRKGALLSFQFDRSLEDKNGSFHMPERWLF